MSPLLSPRILIHRLRHSIAANPRLFRTVFVAILALVLVGISVKYAAKVARPGEDGKQSRSAFLRWRSMILDMAAGANVYIGVNEYPNPPIMAAVLRPFAELPPVAGALAWFYAKVLMAALAALWAFRLIGNVPDWAKALAILCALPPILGDLSHNNVNIFILFLVAACLEAYRRKWDFTSGIVLALAIACKVTPLLFVAYFAWKRSWRALAGCGVGFALWLFVMPGAMFGFERNNELLESWYKLMVRPALVENRVTSEHPNQSLPGVVFRLLTHSPSFIEYDKTPQGDIPRAADFHNLADVGNASARWVLKGLMAAFAILIVALCRAPRTERQGLRFAAECSLIVLGMLLFSERTWKHHAVTLLFPFAVIAYALTTDITSRTRTFLIGVLISVGVLTVGTGALSGRTADLAMVYGSYTAAFLLLTAAVCVVLVNRREPIADAPAPLP
jgi:hypothetical protein